ncbi:MAG: DUF167 domain-containing protein [Legionella sp.]|jgi:hypothetical protein
MWYQYNSDALKIHIYIQPGAKTTEFAGFYDGIPKIRLNSQPIEGRANKDLRAYIAQLFKVPLAKVTLTRGDKSRRKTIEINGSSINPEDLWGTP